MRLTTKGRYAVTAMMDLAIHQETSPVSLSDIALRQGISQSYLGRLLADLHKHELVEGHRGPAGGYTLGRAMDDIYLADILTAVGEKVATMRCGGQLNCQDSKQCLSHKVWENLGQKIWDLMSELSIAELIREPSVRQVAERQIRDSRMMSRVVFPISSGGLQ